MDYLVKPDPADARLTERVPGVDQDGRAIETSVTVERPLTLLLNSQEIVTLMTIGDYVDCLAVGYLINQNMIKGDDEVTGVDYDEESETVVVRTAHETDFEERMKKRTRTSGCALGTVFGDVMETFEEVTLDPDAEIRTSCNVTRAGRNSPNSTIACTNCRATGPAARPPDPACSSTTCFRKGR